MLNWVVFNYKERKGDFYVSFHVSSIQLCVK
uniref:Uncharacterized protein n=1 Tax=Anguilla anguilla TaxID=7936 RepID=A0A0E9SBW5_ANGAN